MSQRNSPKETEKVKCTYAQIPIQIRDTLLSLTAPSTSNVQRSWERSPKHINGILHVGPKTCPGFHRENLCRSHSDGLRTQENSARLCPVALASRLNSYLPPPSHYRSHWAISNGEARAEEESVVPDASDPFLPQP